VSPRWENILFRLIREMVCRRRSGHSNPVNWPARKIAEQLTATFRSSVKDDGYVIITIEGPQFSPTSNKNYLPIMGEFLRHKRREYVVVFLLHGGVLSAVVLQQGDGVSVSGSIPWGEIASRGPDAVLIGHNHPGPNGALSCSGQDRAFKNDIIRRIDDSGIALGFYVFVRGNYRRF